jgi:hypothetical protein
MCLCYIMSALYLHLCASKRESTISVVWAFDEEGKEFFELNHQVSIFVEFFQ